MLAWLRDWWNSIGNSSASAVDVVVYTRQDCHLCDEAWRLLEQRRQQFDMHLRLVEVDRDVFLKQMYGQDVPVVAVNGKVRLKGRINEVLLDRVLQKEASKK